MSKDLFYYLIDNSHGELQYQVCIKENGTTDLIIMNLRDLLAAQLLTNKLNNAAYWWMVKNG